MSITALVIWLVTGFIWAARSLILLADPAYWGPVALVDWIAVWLNAVALLLLAPAVILLARLSPSRAVQMAAAVVAAGAMVAGLAGLIEDGLDVDSLGIAYVIGFVTAGLALVPLAASLWWAGCPRLAMLAFALFLGVLLSSVGGGLIVLVALGALALAPRSFMPSTPGAGPMESTAGRY